MTKEIVTAKDASRESLEFLTRPLLVTLLALALAGCGSAGPAPTRPPDGWIAFVTAGLGGSEGIYLMNPDGSARWRISSASGPGLSWSPDGQRIAFTSNPGISVMRADGSGAIKLTSTGESPGWSPDGQRIAFVVRPNESLTNEPPDAAQIDLIKQEHLRLMNADGSALTSLTNGAVADEWPSWSPDGTRLAFVRRSLAPMTDPGCEGICVVNVDGSSLLQLSADGEYPVWAPDGQTIAYAWSATGGSGIYLIDADRSSSANVTPNLNGHFSYPAWSPDGRKIAFAYGEKGSSIDIYVVNSDGSNLARLTEGVGSIWGLSWR